MVYCQWMQEANPEGIQEAPRQGASTGSLGAVYKLWVRGETISGMTINPYQLQRIEK